MNVLIRDIVGRTAYILASHPFHVITIRSMAQFVGGEEKYRYIKTCFLFVYLINIASMKKVDFVLFFSGIFQSLLELYREQGIWGYFAGLIPRWVGEIASLVLASTVIFTFTNYCIQDRELKSYSTPAIQVIIITNIRSFEVSREF